MNVANIEYKEVTLEESDTLASSKSIFIGDVENSLCDICVNFENPSEAIDDIVEQILESDTDSDVFISSVLGINKGFLEFSDFAWNYTNFFCLLFKRLMTLNRKVNFLQIGAIDSAIVSIFEGIAFSAECECDHINSRSLKIDKEELILEYINKIWSQKYRSILVINNKEYIRRAPLIAEFSEIKKDSCLKQAGIYVITGGNGGIGRLLARWLVETYQARVIFIGRRELDGEAEGVLKNLGVSSYIVADVSDYSKLEEAFIHIKNYYGRIDAVFHLAGTIKDKLLRNYNSEDIYPIISPKIYGTVNLFKISEKIDIGCICLFSSLSGVIGNIGQAIYSAANAFMDDFCLYVRNVNHCNSWYSINWGAWNSDGMQMEIQSSDVELMQPTDCFNLLNNVLCCDSGRFAIWEGNSRLLEKLEERYCVENESNLHELSSSFRERIQDWVSSCIKRFSGFSNIDFEQSIIDLGIDSVGLINIAVYFENEIKKYIPGYRLSKALLFEYFSVNKITSFFVESLPSHVIEEIANNFTNVSSLASNKSKLSNVFEDNLKSEAKIEEVSTNNRKDTHDDYNEEDIAIVGIAGEFPESSSLVELEKLLFEGKCVIKSIPEDRWDWREYYSQDKKDKNASYCRHGGFLKNARGFDNSFFKITPSEAVKMDPQERKFLQTAYHALEDGGYFAINNDNVGVFVAAMFNHYQNLDNKDFALVSNSFASIANRLSFFMNFKGPSVCVDSMCSGSLTALNLAINSITLGECASAVVGGVNVMPHPGKYIVLSQAGFLSPTGKCQSFGIGADGYVPGEGVIAIFIKKLGKAIADGNKIYGIIKGIAVNSVGRSSGYTVPSVSAQVDVVKKALKKASLKPEDITYIETHGTGTALGDPIEIEGIKLAYGQISVASISAENVCWLGAVKSNIGHLESAAGLAGLAKILLQFKNRKIYASLFSAIENQELSLSKTRFKIAKANVDWDYCRYAGLSAFGAGGSNAHVIVQNYENKLCSENALNTYIIPISAKTVTALKKRINDLVTFVENSDYDLYALSYTFCCARQHFDKRVCYSVKDKKELIDSLKNDKFLKSSDDILIRDYINNKSVDFSVLFGDNKFIQSFPPYPFEEDEYWLDFGRHKRSEDNCEHILLAPCYSDVKKTSMSLSEIGNSDITELYVNTTVVNSRGYLVADYEQSVPHKEKNVFVINYKSTKDWDRVFKKLKNKKRLRLIVSSTRKKGSCEEVFQVYFALAKALIKQNTSIEILLLAHRSEENEVDKVQRSIYGLFKSISLEKSNVNVILVEKENTDRDDIILAKCSNICIPKDRKFLHFRVKNQKMQEQSLTEITLCPTSSRLKSKGVYLITGGMGSVGLFIAKFLRKKYDARLVLVGRSEVSEKKIKESFSDLYDDAFIKYIPADVEYLEQVQNVINLSIESFGEINGIIHAAGQIHDALFSEKTEDEFFLTLSVKFKGAENLDICTKNLTLDFFACFSSLVTVTGSVGQSDYITANCYLDAFAQSRNELVRNNKRKGHTISINWPLWVNHEKNYSSLKDYLKDSLGLEVLSEDQGTKLFEGIINGVPDDINQIIPLPGKISLNDFLIYAGYATRKDDQDEQTLQTQENVHYDNSMDVNVDDMRSIVSEITNDTLIIDPDISFGEIGLNSIMLQELAQKIEVKYALPFPVLVLFKYNSLNKLVGYLNKKLGKSLVVAHCNTEERKECSLEDRRVAIIGMSGRMPGAANLNEYWHNLMKNKSAIIPIARWKNRGYFGGLIEDYDLFDYRFFSISLREANLLDPQQRLFLESSYNAIIDSGYKPSDLTKVGVFVGAQFSDYRNVLKKANVAHHPFVAIGNSNNMIANRVSYFFNFSGPSQTVDTACSSSVVAIHRAVDSLLSRECDYCVAGAVSLMLDPETTDGAKSMGVLSPNYRCATFDESADGYVRSEGVGCVLLKRYADAVTDGDSIYGIIESVSEGHGGHSNSITAPNQDAQTELIVSAYNKDLAKRVSYIETHGTGTKLGDPIEVEALKVAWQRLNADNTKHIVYLGAVKSAVGHLEPVSGMASLFKILLAMKYKQIPANLNFNKQNKLIDLEGTNFKLVTKNVEWNGEDALVAGMSCFGFGGSNTHMVLSEYRSENNELEKDSLDTANLFTLSAKTKNSLQEMLNQLILHLSSLDSKKCSLNDISFTLNVGRDHFQYRIAVIASSKEELLQKLKEVAKSDLKKVNLVNKTEAEFKNIVHAQKAYLSGINVNWKALYKNTNHRRLHLPGYSFEKNRCWFKEQENNE